jgi:hypothetical protein
MISIIQVNSTLTYGYAAPLFNAFVNVSIGLASIRPGPRTTNKGTTDLPFQLCYNKPHQQGFI